MYPLPYCANSLWSFAHALWCHKYWLSLEDFLKYYLACKDWVFLLFKTRLLQFSVRQNDISEDLNFVFKLHAEQMMNYLHLDSSEIFCYILKSKKFLSSLVALPSLPFKQLMLLLILVVRFHFDFHISILSRNFLLFRNQFFDSLASIIEVTIYIRNL